MRGVSCVAVLALLTACATPSGVETPAASAPEPAPAGAVVPEAAPNMAATPPPTAEAAEEEASEVAELFKKSGVLQTASQPLVDLNLLQSKIPAVLTAAQKGPYAAPVDVSCKALLAELRALDAALGPDVDAIAAPGADPDLVDQAVDLVSKAAMGTVKSTVNTVVDGVIPFRSWVRKLSGAERYSRTVAAAVSAGTIRRPFLKGWARSAGCDVTPKPPPKAKPKPKEAPREPTQTLAP